MKLSDWSENGSIHATYVCSITSTVRPVRYPFYHANALLYLTLSGIISKKKRMKIRILSFLTVVAVALTSCDLDGSSNYTPNIFFIQHPTNQKGDSLNSFYTDKAGVYLMDTITVGDTILFYLYLDAYANELTSFQISQSADSVSRIIWPLKSSMDTIFTAGSDYNKGKFVMDGTRNSLRFPFRYVAMKPGKEAKLEFSVSSNAQFEGGFASNVNSLQLKTPIKAAPAME